MRSARMDYRRRRHERVAGMRRRRRRVVARGVRQPALLPLAHGADADEQVTFVGGVFEWGFATSGELGREIHECG